MEDPIDWQVVENSSAENRELGEVLRKLEGLHHDGSPLDWQEPRQRRGDALAPLVTGCSKSRRLSTLLEGTEYEVGGASGRRYLATNTLLQVQYSRGLGSGLYSGSLDTTLYSKAPKVNWKPPLPTRRSGLALCLFRLTIFRLIP